MKIRMYRGEICATSCLYREQSLSLLMMWQAEREPLLSSFLYASILAHPCFERSLGFVLANRLTSATLLATQLMDVFDGVFMTDPFIRQAIRLDVQVSNCSLILGLSSDFHFTMFWVPLMSRVDMFRRTY